MTTRGTAALTCTGALVLPMCSTGRERRRWHPVGTDRTEAEQLAARLAPDHRARRTGPTLGVYLTRTWLPTKQLTLRPSTWDTYRRNITFMTSSPIYSRAIRKNTAPFTAQRAMQDDAPR